MKKTLTCMMIFIMLLSILLIPVSAEEEEPVFTVESDMVYYDDCYSGFFSPGDIILIEFVKGNSYPAFQIFKDGELYQYYDYSSGVGIVDNNVFEGQTRSLTITEAGEYGFQYFSCEYDAVGIFKITMFTNGAHLIEDAYDRGYDEGSQIVVGSNEAYEKGWSDYQNGYIDFFKDYMANSPEAFKFEGIDLETIKGTWTVETENGGSRELTGVNLNTLYDKGIDFGWLMGNEWGYHEGFQAGLADDTNRQNAYNEGYKDGFGQKYSDLVDGIDKSTNDIINSIDESANGSWIQGFLAGMWNGMTAFISMILTGVTFSGLSLMNILATAIGILAAAFVIKMIKG